MFELRREIFQRGGYKAPGPDMIIWRVLKECIDEVAPHLLASVTNACKVLPWLLFSLEGGGRSGLHQAREETTTRC